MNRIVFSLLTILLLPSFTFHEPHYCKIVDKLTIRYLKEVAVSKGLILSGYGGAMMDDIQEISLSFFSRDALSVDEARVLYIEMMEEFLKRINAYEKIRPYLHNFPFEIDNIELDIRFLDSKGHTRSDGHVALLFRGKKHILYFEAYNPLINNFYTLNKETYEEAHKKVIGN